MAYNFVQKPACLGKNDARLLSQISGSKEPCHDRTVTVINSHATIGNAQRAIGLAMARRLDDVCGLGCRKLIEHE